METATDLRNVYSGLKRHIINPAFDDTVTFVETCRESGGRQTSLLITLGPGGRNDMHTHKTYTETFEPVSGTLMVVLASGKKLLQPGESFTVPIGAAHCFANPGTEEITFRCIIKPGHEGFETGLRILYGLAVDGKSKIDSWETMLKAAVILMLSDMRLCGPKALMNPLIPYLYKLAQKRGIEQLLRDKYVI